MTMLRGKAVTPGAGSSSGMGTRLCPIRAAGRRVLQAGALLSACTSRSAAALPVLVSSSAVKVLAGPTATRPKSPAAHRRLASHHLTIGLPPISPASTPSPAR